MIAVPPSPCLAVPATIKIPHLLDPPKSAETVTCKIRKMWLGKNEVSCSLVNFPFWSVPMKLISHDQLHNIENGRGVRTHNHS